MDQKKIKAFRERLLQKKSELLDAFNKNKTYGMEADEEGAQDIADKASVSTGSVYHHFRDKEAIFKTLLDQFWSATVEPSFPLNRVFESGAFPDDLEAVGAAARDVAAIRDLALRVARDGHAREPRGIPAPSRGRAAAPLHHGRRRLRVHQ